MFLTFHRNIGKKDDDRGEETPDHDKHYREQTSAGKEAKDTDDQGKNQRVIGVF